MLKRDQTNADPDRPTLRSGVAAASEPVRGAAWAFEQRVVWRAADGLRRVLEVARWPFERIAFILERRVVWPLDERSAGWILPGGRGGTGVLAGTAAAAALGVLAVVFGSGSGGGGWASVEQARVALGPVEAPAGEAQPKRPTLQGVAPSFAAAGASRARKSSDERKVDLTSPTTGAVPGSEGGGQAGGGEGAAATTSAAKPVPAGPAAMKVARRFAQAFVLFEVGRKQAQAKAVFKETASLRLARALSRRPPRLPESVKVPQARVVNLVAGPRRGNAYTVSVSLLRVGVTSELRLSLRPGNDGDWEVADVLG